MISICKLWYGFNYDINMISYLLKVDAEPGLSGCSIIPRHLQPRQQLHVNCQIAQHAESPAWADTCLGPPPMYGKRGMLMFEFSIIINSVYANIYCVKNIMCIDRPCMSFQMPFLATQSANVRLPGNFATSSKWRPAESICKEKATLINRCCWQASKIGGPYSQIELCCSISSVSHLLLSVPNPFHTVTRLCHLIRRRALNECNLLRT